MIIFTLGALCVVVLVALSVLSARATLEGTIKFPWFWVFFSVASFSLVGACAAFQEMISFEYGWTMMQPEEAEIYSSEYRPDLFDWYNYQFLSFVLALVGFVIGIVGSILSWRKQRI